MSSNMMGNSFSATANLTPTAEAYVSGYERRVKSLVLNDKMFPNGFDIFVHEGPALGYEAWCELEWIHYRNHSEEVRWDSRVELGADHQ